jgi:hypothetical protein
MVAGCVNRNFVLEAGERLLDRAPPLQRADIRVGPEQSFVNGESKLTESADI